jgi:hypothetical protein
MPQLSAHGRLWLVAIAIAIVGFSAATFAPARGSAPTDAQPQRPGTHREPIDDTRPVGPSDPAGLVGALVPNSRGAVR